MPASLVSEGCVSSIPSSFMFVMYTLLCAIKEHENSIAAWKDAEYYLKDEKQLVSVFSK